MRQRIFGRKFAWWHDRAERWRRLRPEIDNFLPPWPVLKLRDYNTRAVAVTPSRSFPGIGTPTTSVGQNVTRWPKIAASARCANTPAHDSKSIDHRGGRIVPPGCRIIEPELFPKRLGRIRVH